eukprot:comp19543_c0_seq1/m.37238 comp19543_c0_seq1/g.37238  ORF comp19543_c0_seq1/g.37238 comp19543_c0_seq1/m.37238 type:complete len:306 (+) comp19543_c0_seq1:17-934(+)
MSLEVSPLELCFPPPLDKVIACTLRLFNPSENVIAFKVKTTAPKRYCVRPNSGIVNPNERVEVQILLQPIPGGQPEEVKSKDKFLVQSLRIRPEDAGDLARVWNGDAAGINEVKLKVFFQTAQDRALQAGSETPRQSTGGNAGGAAGAFETTPEPIYNPVTARAHQEPPAQSRAPAVSAQAAATPGAREMSRGGAQGGDVEELRRRYVKLEEAMIATQSDRDQLHDALSQATSKLEEVISARKRIEEERDQLLRAKSGGPRPPSPDHETKAKSGFSLTFLLIMCLAFLIFGAVFGNKYVPANLRS